VGPAADGSGGLLGSAEPSPTARCDPDASARGLAAAGNDLALLQVCLPDPAPGFPLRRAHDSTAMTSFNAGVAVPTRTFLVGVKPPITKQLGGGATESTPTGQEATVMVARAGAFPTTPDGVRAQREYTVTGTTPVRGADATVVRVDGELQIGVLVTVNGFDVAAFGSYDATPDAPVTVDQLVALIDSLQHLE
jgi:hypothetical protein